MSLTRFAKRRDACEKPIVDALERVGVKVYRIDRPADLLLWYRNNWLVLECKSRKRNDQPEQDAFRKLTGTPVVATVEEALRVIR